MSGAANSAAGALVALKGKIDADTAALRQMQASLRAMKGGTDVAKEAVSALKDKIDAQKNAIAQATAGYVELGGSFEKVAPEAKEAATSLEGLAKETKKLGLAGPDAVFDFIGAMGTLPGLAMTAAAAVVALTAAVIGLAAKGLRALVGAALEAQSELRAMSLELEAAAVSGGTLAKGATEAVLAVSRGVPIAREKVSGLASELLKAGASSAQLGAALEAASIAESVGVGPGTLDELKAAIKAGGDVAAIAEKIRGKYGAIVGRQMLDWNVQLAKAKETMGALFAGVKIEPLLEGLRDFLKLFEDTTSTGRALKTMIETLLNPIFGSAPGASSALQSVFKGAIVGALKVGIAILLVRNNLRDMVGSVNLGGWAVDWRAVGTAALFVAGAIAAVVGVVSVFAGLIVGSVAVVLGFGVALGLVIAKVFMFGASLVSGIGKAVSSLWNYAASFAAMGADFVAGLAQGIWDGLSSVVQAAVGVAKGAVEAVEKTLDMHSPSKVFQKIGRNVGLGMEDGLDASGPGVADATSNMISIPSAKGGGAAAGGARGGGTWHVTITGVPNAEKLTDPSFQGALEEAFERATAVLGFPLEPEGA